MNVAHTHYHTQMRTHTLTQLSHTSLRDGILNGGCGFLFFESVQERDDWFRLLRRHTGHHRIQNVFQHATAAIGSYGTRSAYMEHVHIELDTFCISHTERVTACYSRYSRGAYEDTHVVVCGRFEDTMRT
jgi:hypothetical protein